MSGTALTTTPSTLPFVSRAADRISVPTSAVAFAGVSLLALVAPFERIDPLVRLPMQLVSNLEAAVLAALVAWGAALCRARRLPVWRTPLTTPWLVLIAAMACAAVAAPDHRLNALNMTGRIGAALGVYLLAVNGVTTRARLLAVCGLSLAAAAVVSMLAVMEYLTVPVVLRWLKAFRPQVMTVGSLVRAGGPLQYPTIASMYLEVTFAIGVGLLLASRDDSRLGRVAAAFATLVLIAGAITLSFTRSGLILMAIALAWIGVMRARRNGVDGGVRLVALLAGSVLAVVLASRSVDSIWLRFTTEGQESWYGADIEAPPEIAVATGAVAQVPVSLTNRGRLDWSSRGDSPFFLSYHWMVVDADRYVVFDGMRTPLDAPVAPGATAALTASVRAPRVPGRYRLVWDMVQERHTWFSDEPGATVTTTIATVEGPALAGATSPFPRPRPGWRPGRLVLWRAAAKLVADHPLLGVGPDNFRLTYARYARLGAADSRTHANNMYLEMLAGGGLVTALAFGWFLWRAWRLCADAVRGAWGPASAGPSPSIALGVAAAGIAIAAHGLVDSFLEFAPLYVVFSLTLGLAAACARGVETCADAHRL